jgi:cytoskeletal protein RodZ
MSDGLKKMGDRFRAKREEMSLSLKEIENATSIRILYLQAIEEGKVEHFLSTAYALGFIRQYGSFLGFDMEKVAKEHPDAFRLAPEKQDFAYGIGTLEMRGNPHGGIRWMPNLLWGSAIFIVIICAYFLAKAVGIF